jgi:hypothetical protein
VPGIGKFNKALHRLGRRGTPAAFFRLSAFSKMESITMSNLKVFGAAAAVTLMLALSPTTSFARMGGGGFGGGHMGGADLAAAIWRADLAAAAWAGADLVPAAPTATTPTATTPSAAPTTSGPGRPASDPAAICRPSRFDRRPSRGCQPAHLPPASALAWLRPGSTAMPMMPAPGPTPLTEDPAPARRGRGDLIPGGVDSGRS